MNNAGANTKQGEFPSEDDDAELKQIEDQIDDGAFAKKARGWCGCQLANLLYIGLFFGIQWLSIYLGKPWIFAVFMCLVIATGLAITAWILSTSFISRNRRSSQPATASTNEGAPQLPANVPPTPATVSAFDYTTQSANPLEFAMRGERVAFEWLVGVLIISCFGIGILIGIIWPAMRWGNLAPAGGWGGLIISMLVATGILWFFPRHLTNAVAQVRTKYSPEGISRFNLRRKRWISWKDISRAELYGENGKQVGFFFWLYTPGEIMRIDLGYYRKPKTTYLEIKKRLPVKVKVSKRKTILPFETDDPTTRRQTKSTPNV